MSLQCGHLKPVCRSERPASNSPVNGFLQCGQTMSKTRDCGAVSVMSSGYLPDSSARERALPRARLRRRRSYVRSPARHTFRAMQVRFCDEFEHGFGWMVDEFLRRCSRALVVDGRVWLVDPLE